MTERSAGASTEESPARRLYRRAMFMVCLVGAGEAIFGLPFHVPRFFRSQFLEAFGVTATELGAAQGAYGVTAMAAYLLGGPLADRFPPRTLMIGSLVATALGGVYMATFPGFLGLSVLFGYWGVSTILLFWAALISATRSWGGHDEQGAAFGILEGGRGALAAFVGVSAVLVFEALLPADPAAATAQDNTLGVRVMIFIYTLTTLGAAALVWRFVPKVRAASAERPPMWKSVRTVLRFPAVWLQALIVVCAYVGYKGLDNYQLYLVQAHGMEEIEASRLMTYGFWTRAFAAAGAGLIGDRIRSYRVVIVCFIGLFGVDAYLALTNPSGYAILLASVLLTCVAAFGLRGVYFALLEEGNVPASMTGVAVGLVSFIGYAPDTFVTLVAGLLNDRSPGLEGHQSFFWFLAGFAGLGLVASLAFSRVRAHPPLAVASPRGQPENQVVPSG